MRSFKDRRCEDTKLGMSSQKGKEKWKQGGAKIPRTRRLIINDETAVYHAWDVEPNSPRHTSI